MNFILFKQSKVNTREKGKGLSKNKNSEEVWNNFKSNSPLYSIEFDGSYLSYRSKSLLKYTLSAFAGQENLKISIADVRGIKVKRLLGVELIHLYTLTHLAEGGIDKKLPVLVLFSNKEEASRKLQEILIESVVSKRLSD